jgi:uncharacterized membrane protein YphA (DoxX/SURF4 family)
MYTFIHGFAFTDGVQLLARLLLGVFFILARFRFFYDPAKPVGERWFNRQRHDSLRNKMIHCGLTRWPYAWACFVACVEVFAGLGVVFGLLSLLSAFGLLVITLVGTRCTAYQKVHEQNPVDKVDVCSAYLWRVEGLYIAFAVLVIFGGPGAYSLDAWLWG